MVATGVVLGVLALVIVVSLALGTPPRGTARLADLARDAQRWSAASRSAPDPLLGVLNAAYGNAYWNVARSLAADDDALESAAGVRVADVTADMADAQTAAIARLGLPPQAAALQTGWLTGAH